MRFELKDRGLYSALSRALPGFEERFQSCCRAQFLKENQYCVDVTSESGYIDNFDLYQDWHVSFYFAAIQPIFENGDPFFLGDEPPQVTDENWDKFAFCEQNTLYGHTSRFIAKWTGCCWATIPSDLNRPLSAHELKIVRPIRYIPTCYFPYCCTNHETH